MSQLLTAAVCCACALLLFEWVLIGTPYGYYFTYIGDSGLLRAVARVGLWLVTIGLQVAWCATWFASGWLLRVTSVAAFGGITYVQYGYIQATGAFITGHDFEVALGAPMHWTAMAEHFTSLWSLVPVAAGLVMLIIVRPAPPRATWRHHAMLVAVTLVGHALYVLPQSLGPTGKNEFIHQGQPLISSQSFARAVVQFGVSRVMSAYRRSQRGDRLDVPRLDTPPPGQHIVLVVDESIRADHLSLNGYQRQTTPFLEQLLRDGRAVNWGAAASYTPYSNDSVLSLLTGIRNLPDRQQLSLTWPTVFQYAKGAGYTTHWFDGGGWHRRFGFSDTDFVAVDHWQTRTQLGNDVYTDDRIADAVAPLLTRTDSQFIVVLKRGNHIPFDDNYPPDAAVWRTTPPSVDAGRDPWLVELINRYDNAVQFGVDRFLERLLRVPEVESRAVILYTSDHGQALRRIQLGGPTRHLFWGDLAVPLVMIGGPMGIVDTDYRAHHANLLPTLLDLMAVPHGARPVGYARSLLTARATDRDTRYVFTGDYFGFGPFTRGNFDDLRADGAWNPPR